MIANLDDLKQRINILEVIESYLPLRKEGVNYKTLCPFHSEKSPSFVVSQSKNMFYCFGCGESGDAISFLQKYKKLGFTEAVQEVADLIGFELEIEKGKFQKDLTPILEYANVIFLNELEKLFSSNDKKAQWLINRGLSLELCKKYDIGFCSKEALEMIKKQYHPRDLHEAGILNNDKCFLYDRVSIGIRNDNHKLRGFSGRTHPYSNFKNSAKYINSRENALFKKSFLFYGSSYAKSEIVKKEQIILCEGFFDVIAFHKFGYKNAVCSIGTAFNKTHLAHIFKLKTDCEIVFCFDNDQAGQEANLRALKMCFDNEYFHVSVVVLESSNKDMGDFLKEEAPPKMKKINGFKYYCQVCLQKAHNDLAKDKIYKELFQIATKAPPFTQSSLKGILAKLTPKEVISYSTQTHTSQSTQKEPKTQNNTNCNNAYNLENSILHTMLENSEFFSIAKSFLSIEDFSNKQAYEALLRQDYKVLGFLQNARLLTEEQWSESLEFFKKQGLKRSLALAQESNDLNAIIALREKIHALEMF